ncbi:hypothetical protein T01_12932 [Trichinella spiralis]|uniref:Uncharacterized protein n=1 Tax=Trichinella spiralis TaxID=6334 RepID=A0A0V1C0L0_TRISP|nr:hypothetical protein T01_12932 [Trichinella spiralis]
MCTNIVHGEYNGFMNHFVLDSVVQMLKWCRLLEACLPKVLKQIRKITEGKELPRHINSGSFLRDLRFGLTANNIVRRSRFLLDTHDGRRR